MKVNIQPYFYTYPFMVRRAMTGFQRDGVDFVQDEDGKIIASHYSYEDLPDHIKRFGVMFEVSLGNFIEAYNNETEIGSN